MPAPETAEALAFIHKVERDNAEDFASDIADDLRRMRGRFEALQKAVAIRDQVIATLVVNAKRGCGSDELVEWFEKEAKPLLIAYPKQPGA